MEVKKLSSKKEVKRILLLGILNLLKSGKIPSQIAKDKKISKQLLSYYMRELKVEGLVRKIGYGTWEVLKEVKECSKDTLHFEKEVRGHAFIWKIRLPKVFDWSVLLKRKAIVSVPVGLKATPRVLIMGRKVWLGKKNVIVFENSSFFGKTAVESRKYAVVRLLAVIGAIEEAFGISLRSRVGYVFKPRKSHYSLIKNVLAVQCNESGQKLKVSYYGETWFLIDNSFNLDEAETVHPKDSLIDSVGVQRYFNSHKKTGFKVTPEFVLEVMGGIQANQLVFDKNMASHLEILNKIGKAIDELREEIKKKGGQNGF